MKVGLAEQLENIAILWLERKWPLVNVKKDAKEHPVHKLTTLGYEKEFSEVGADYGALLTYIDGSREISLQI